MIKTIEELCDYIAEYAGYIFVREQIDGKWGSYSLTELPPAHAIEHALRFIKEGRVPVRLKTDEEIALISQERDA